MRLDHSREFLQLHRDTGFYSFGINLFFVKSLPKAF
jgi:hypothetical protein